MKMPLKEPTKSPPSYKHKDAKVPPVKRCDDTIKRISLAIKPSRTF